MPGLLQPLSGPLAEAFPRFAEPIHVLAFLLPYYLGALVLYYVIRAARSPSAAGDRDESGDDEESSGDEGFDNDGASDDEEGRSAPGTPARAPTPEQRAEELRRSTRRRRPARAINSPFRQL